MSKYNKYRYLIYYPAIKLSTGTSLSLWLFFTDKFSGHVQQWSIADLCASKIISNKMTSDLDMP